MPYPDTWKAEAEKRVSSFLACRRSWVQAMNMKTRNMKKEDKRKKRKNETKKKERERGRKKRKKEGRRKRGDKSFDKREPRLCRKSLAHKIKIHTAIKT